MTMEKGAHHSAETKHKLCKAMRRIANTPKHRKTTEQLVRRNKPAFRDKNRGGTI